ncbi:MAG: FAD-dependent oxidoreductase [Candidatus Limnocylindrales bacterium]
MDQARIVVIGGGITGCSIAYHLGLAGERDVLLLEKAQLTAGSTCHAAGLVTVFNPAPTMMGFRRYSVELYERLGVFERVGSLRLASSPEQLGELERTASRARGIGLDVEVVSAAEAQRRMPALSADSLYGGVWVAGDGHLDPHTTTHALAGAARDLGVRIRQGVRVTGFTLSARRAVTQVLTEAGPIATELVVDAAGIWAPQVAAMAGAFIPSTPVDHQHISLRAVPGHELPDDMACFRDPDNLVYGRSEHGGVLFGGYEVEPAARWVDGVPWDHAAQSLPPDYERFAPLMAGAVRRFPFLADAEVIRLVCHPDAMTPDANPLLGPLPGLHGFWVAAGLSLNGFGGAGGIGRAIAGWMTADDPGCDVVPYRGWRFADTYRDSTWCAALARETYADYYRLRFPHDADLAGRPRRLSPLHGRLQEGGATFGTKAGWERADYLEKGRPWRRAGRDQRDYGWHKPPWFDSVRDEWRAVRERAGLIDLTSFGKIAVAGPGALGLLQRVCANDVGRPIGSVVYSQMLDERGGMLADVTVTRLAEERFRVVTGAGYLGGDLGWLRANVGDDEAPVSLRDESEDWACLGLWGPHAREILSVATDAELSDAVLPLRQARWVEVGGGPVLAARISYAGELGWELYVAPEWATQAWDRLVDAGHGFGLAPFGYRTLDALRMEKGYRYYGTDLTSAETPDEAGLGAFVRTGKGAFLGREAILEQRGRQPAGPARRLRTVLIGDEAYVPVYGGEAVRDGPSVLGRLRSVAYGYGLSRTIAYVYLPSTIAEGERLEVDVFGLAVPAVVAADVLHDPTGARLRG